jgi:hypothetical protein
VKQTITRPDFMQKRLFERPDGFFWEDVASGKTYGPFATLLEAENDMRYSVEEEPEPGETVQEAESEMGIADWVDPETGEPAEEQVPRIEEH